MKSPMVFAVLATILPAVIAGCTGGDMPHDHATDSTVASHQERKVLYWYDPMNPTVRFQHAGKSPFMDMELQPMYADESVSDPNVISVDPAMVQNIGVVTAPVVRRTLTRTITTYGVVSPDEKSISDINTRVSGWIERLYFDYTGMEVRKGQPMAEIYSPELIAAEQEFLQAVTFATAGGNTVTSASDLITSAADRLRFFGMSDEQISELKRTGSIVHRVVIHSMDDGVILEKDVFEGQKISAGQTLFRIANLRRVWILADIFRTDLPFLKIGSPATVIYAHAGSFKSSVDFVYPDVDPMARSVKVRILLNNPHLKMKIGEYVNVAIHSPIRFDALAVPSQAVINTGMRQVVAIALGDGKFQIRDVTLGPHADGYDAVEDGLTEGEMVVTSGQFLIDSDASLKAAGASLMSGTAGTSGTENDSAAASVHGRSLDGNKPKED